MPAVRAFARSSPMTSQETPLGADRAGSWGSTSRSTNARMRSRTSACSGVGAKLMPEVNPSPPRLDNPSPPDPLSRARERGSLAGRPDQIKSSRKVAGNQLRGDSEHSVARLLQVLVALGVVLALLSMDRAVNFHDHAGF